MDIDSDSVRQDGAKRREYGDRSPVVVRRLAEEERPIKRVMVAHVNNREEWAAVGFRIELKNRISPLSTLKSGATVSNATTSGENGPREQNKEVQCKQGKAPRIYLIGIVEKNYENLVAVIKEITIFHTI